ncbi:unnamed protein product [Lactuca virosa]|uniref:Glycosyltransferase n=1 Tax=Lactuca virosa TaxID=75947 RepID=A0AAU9MD83_9ASTR|nr:unnamed protein product [Lactuca virosa]
MDEYNRIDVQRNSGRQSSRPVSKSLLSGKSTPRGSPSFRRLNSSRTPRKDGRTGGFGTNCFKSNRIVLWLLLITLWAYAGFYIQSRWAHGDNNEGIFGGNDSNDESDKTESEQVHRRDLSVSNDSFTDQVVINVNQPDVKKTNMVKNTTHGVPQSHTIIAIKKRTKRSRRKREDKVLEWSPTKRSGTCDRKSQFARLVWSRKFVLIFHELSMTGAPLSMMELATELLSCGATVSVVALSRRGGLLTELARKKIRVLEDKDKISFKTAMKADLVIAGSAVCSSWIEQYLDHSVAGTRQLVWWIMENRREYFDRSKLVLTV